MKDMLKCTWRLPGEVCSFVFICHVGFDWEICCVECILHVLIFQRGDVSADWEIYPDIPKWPKWFIPHSITAALFPTVGLDIFRVPNLRRSAFPSPSIPVTLGKKWKLFNTVFHNDPSMYPQVWHGMMMYDVWWEPKSIPIMYNDWDNS